jgi:aspartate aminotransferase-like enzyme
VDVLVSASQKALMCPPGLAIVSASAKACVEIQKEHRCSRFYWDFRKALATSENNETPFTTPVSLMRGLLEALAMMHEEGLQNVLKRHHELASEFRKGAVALGFRIYGQPGSRSDTVVALRVPESVNGGDIVRRLYQEHHTVIAGSRNKLSGQVIRVGTMGAFDIDDVRTDLAFLKEALEYLDAPVETAVASTSSFELRSKVWQVK